MQISQEIETQKIVHLIRKRLNRAIYIKRGCGTIIGVKTVMDFCKKICARKKFIERSLKSLSYNIDLLWQSSKMRELAKYLVISKVIFFKTCALDTHLTSEIYSVKKLLECNG